MSPRVYCSLDDVPADFGPCVLTIGNFDGVHVGHRAILRRVAGVARERGWKPSALTFDPHPVTVVAPENRPALLSSIEERSQRMSEEGIEQILVLPFTAEFSQVSAEEFVARVLAAKLKARAVMVGRNFRFGRGQEGDAKKLTAFGVRYGFSTEILDGVRIRGRMVSSSAVRRLIGNGDISLAGRMLGRSYGVEGEVVRGRGIGSKHTVPTLNLATQAEVLPANGVYVTRTSDLESGRRWPSVTNIGVRPTFGDGSLSIESFLLDELRGEPPQRLRVEFLHRLRGERKFTDAAALKQQILRDVVRSHAWFRRWGKWVAGSDMPMPRATQ